MGKVAATTWTLLKDGNSKVLHAKLRQHLPKGPALVGETCIETPQSTKKKKKLFFYGFFRNLFGFCQEFASRIRSKLKCKKVESLFEADNLPETNIFAPENGSSEYVFLSVWGPGLFSEETPTRRGFVSGSRVNIKPQLGGFAKGPMIGETCFCQMSSEKNMVNMVPPNHPCYIIRISIIFTIHFGVPIFLETSIKS